MTKSTTSGTSTSVPGFQPQSAALTTAMNGATNVYGSNASNSPSAPTNFTAGMTPDQLSVFSQMLGTGQGALGGATAGTNAGSGMTTAGAAGATGALSALMGYDPTAINNVNATVQGGLAYANNQDIAGAVRAAMQPAMETARDVTLPGITSGAAGTGNINSNRPDIASGIVQRGLGETAANDYTSLYNNAFNTGAQLTSNQNTSNNSAKLGALSAALSGGTSLATGGAGVANTGASTLGDLYNMMTTGAAGPQQAQQLDLQNQLQQYQGANSLPYTNLQNLMNIVGTQSWGTNTNSTQTQTPSAMQTIAGLMSAAGGLIGSGGGVLGGGSGILGLLPK